MLELAPDQFSQEIWGTPGSFTTHVGTIDFLLARAQLGSTDPAKGPTREQNLTEHLRPFREVIPVKDLEFGQLLQRDINDDRVARSIIPYLLEQHHRAPPFFPPIVAMLLPFTDAAVGESFPGGTPVSMHEEGGLRLAGYRAGHAFKIEYHHDSNGERSALPLARLSWTPNLARPVVLDGQHRAMGLLAIQRTLLKTWDDTSGREFKPFYEHQVHRLIKDLGRTEEQAATELRKVEQAVLICWLPLESSAATDAFGAARELFVVMNKEARPPSPSRLILLSERDLVHIFTRNLLDQLRTDPHDARPPIYAIEYDNPSERPTSSEKWSALTNLDLISTAVLRLVWGPQGYLSKPEEPMPRGQPRREDMDAFMREHQLKLTSLFTSPDISDGDRTLERSKLGRNYFPVEHLDNMSKQFLDSWGAAIVTLLGTVLPYKAHNDALRKLRNEWDTSDTAAVLAKDALFEGVGMYWTIKAMAENWEALRRPDESEAAIEKAWRMIEGKREAFEHLRAAAYVGESDEGRVGESFRILLTNACQLGLLLAFGSIAYFRQTPLAEINGLAERLSIAWNAALTTPNEPNRRYFVTRTDEARINLVEGSAMRTSAAVYFRYLWLELLATEPAATVIADKDLSAEVENIIKRARQVYVKYVVGVIAAGLRAESPGLSKSESEKKAQPSAKESIERGLARWFGRDKDELAEWFATTPGLGESGGADDEDASVGDAEESGAGDEGDEDSPVLEEGLE